MTTPAPADAPPCCAPRTPDGQALAEVLAIVSDWVCESNDSGGIDADDLTWRLEKAGYPLPDPGA